jgi:uncharacterized membrane protein YheB (UPF0754 family)
MYLYFFPLVAALIGWLCNFIFVNYLFSKLIPAKAPDLAAAAGRYVSSNLLQSDKLSASLTDPAKLAALRPVIEAHIDVFLKEKLKEKMPAIAMFIGEKTIDMMKKSLMEEIDLLLPNLLGQYLGNIGDKLNVEKILSEKLASLPEGHMEALLQQHLKKEKRQFLLLGALCGFIIGSVLVAVVLAAG